MTRDNLINVKELGIRIKQKRDREKMSLRAVAKITDVSPSTLSRIESDKPVTPDAPTLARLAKWLQIPMERIMVNAAETLGTPMMLYPTESTPSFVEACLRADEKLSPETARALSDLFRAAYEGVIHADHVARES
ncbi:MAG: helix-turn-helix transcriptional regulator [Acidobacteria bacterium]|nr:helix-turn-helix transcriptional regulator [Acidobacteriota bacterium]